MMTMCPECGYDNSEHASDLRNDTQLPNLKGKMNISKLLINQACPICMTAKIAERIK